MELSPLKEERPGESKRWTGSLLTALPAPATPSRGQERRAFLHMHTQQGSFLPALADCAEGRQDGLGV